MEIVTILVILIVVVLAVFLFKFLGKAVSFALSLVGIVIVVWLIVIGLRFMDTKNLQDNFLDSNNLFVLADEDNFITGFATNEPNEMTNLADIYDDLSNPNSDLFDKYYKVVIVEKDSMPHITTRIIDSSKDVERVEAFRGYVEDNFLDEDIAEILVEEEQLGNIEVHKETLAFRHGFREIISP
jgi:hypothetical protein